MEQGLVHIIDLSEHASHPSGFDPRCGANPRILRIGGAIRERPQQRCGGGLDGRRAVRAIWATCIEVISRR